jgi:hypothetical protein
MRPLSLLKSRRAWFIGVPLLIVCWFASAYPRGMLMACLDYARGRHEIKGYGHLPSWQRFDQIILQKYGVRVDHVATCLVSQDVEWYANGYNSVATELLKNKFGKDIVEECWNEDEKERERILQEEEERRARALKPK